MAGLPISLAIAADTIFIFVAVTWEITVCLPPPIFYPTHGYLHFTLRERHALSHDNILHREHLERVPLLDRQASHACRVLRWMRVFGAAESMENKAVRGGVLVLEGGHYIYDGPHVRKGAIGSLPRGDFRLASSVNSPQQ